MTTRLRILPMERWQPCQTKLQICSKEWQELVRRIQTPYFPMNSHLGKMTSELMTWRWKNELWWTLLLRNMTHWEWSRGSQRTQSSTNTNWSSTRSWVQWEQRLKRCYRSKGWKRLDETLKSKSLMRTELFAMLSGWSSKNEALSMAKSPINLNSNRYLNTINLNNKTYNKIRKSNKISLIKDQNN